MQYSAFSWENASAMVAVSGNSTASFLATARAKMFPVPKLSVLVVNIVLPIVSVLTSGFITEIFVNQ
eukprot:3085289-Heterocapsa_arctica.AAC.1